MATLAFKRLKAANSTNDFRKQINSH